MYYKLIRRNIGRGTKDYAIYFFTLFISIALMFSFFNLAFSEDIRSLSDNMEGLSSVVIAISLLLTIAIAFTVNYATTFIISKRNCEFATYALLGMKPKVISPMFCAENAVIGLIALLLGLFFGAVLSQAFTAVIMGIFEKEFVPRVSVGLLLFTAVIANGFVGNPVSKMIADREIKAHIAKNYSDLNLTVTDIKYNFKFSRYFAHAQSPTSPDTGFAVYYGEGQVPMIMRAMW